MLRVSLQQLVVSSVLLVRHNLLPKRPVFSATTPPRIPLNPVNLPLYSVACQISSNSNSSSSKQAVVDCLAPTWRLQSQAVCLATPQPQRAAQAVACSRTQRPQPLSQPRRVEASSAAPLRSSPRRQQQLEESSVSSSSSNSKSLRAPCSAQRQTPRQPVRRA